MFGKGSTAIIRNLILEDFIFLTKNVDTGVLFDECSNCTFDGVKFTSSLGNYFTISGDYQLVKINFPLNFQ